MTPEERQLLNGLFDRIRAAAGNSRDREAETLIADAVRAQPYAPYLLAQAVIVQEEGLKAASARIEELEAKLRDVESRTENASGGFLGNIGKSLFGESRSAPEPAPRPGPWDRSVQSRAAPSAWAQPQPQGYGQSQQPQAGGWGQGAAAPAAGGGFLKGALGTAAGVAGGMMLANSLSGLFHGQKDSLGIGSGFDPMPKSAGASPLDDKAQYSNANYDSDASADYDDSNYADDDASGGWGDGGGDDTTEA